jgi:hypothetical protein
MKNNSKPTTMKDDYLHLCHLRLHNQEKWLNVHCRCILVLKDRGIGFIELPGGDIHGWVPLKEISTPVCKLMEGKLDSIIIRLTRRAFFEMLSSC